jgi:hypothetical protein
LAVRCTPILSVHSRNPASSRSVRAAIGAPVCRLQPRGLRIGTLLTG